MLQYPMNIYFFTQLPQESNEIWNTESYFEHDFEESDLDNDDL